MRLGYNDIINQRLFPPIFILGLAGIALSLSMGQLPIAMGLIGLPVLFIMAIQSVRYPVALFFIIFTVNYYLLAATRYIQIDGISFLMDSLMALLFVLIIIHSALSRDIEWKHAINTFTIGMFIWLLYCLAEIANPTGLLEAWLLSRSLILNGFLISLIISLVITKNGQVRWIITLLSIFSLSAALKAFAQKYIGFDYGELQWLNNGGALTHIIGYGTRYFSFFTDAGNFGSNMGCASLLFALMAIYVSKIGQRIYYFSVAIICLIAMFMSGTRGAMIVPIGGLMLYTLMSKNLKACILGGLSLIFLYVFFAFTTIGQSNVMIRRMRTAFTPSYEGLLTYGRKIDKSLPLRKHEALRRRHRVIRRREPKNILQVHHLYTPRLLLCQDLGGDGDRGRHPFLRSLLHQCVPGGVDCHVQGKGQGAERPAHGSPLRHIRHVIKRLRKCLSRSIPHVYNCHNRYNASLKRRVF